MAATPNFPMPFEACPCAIWYPKESFPDAYNNTLVEYGERPDWEGECVYHPGANRADTSNDIEQGRPYGAEVKLTLYLRKSFNHSLRKAHIALYPADDAALCGRVFEVIGDPFSYSRANTPGDYSWAVEVGDVVG